MTALQPPPLAPLLALRGLRKSHASQVVLRDITLDVPEHDCLVLVGASGSGKSTLLRCINLLDEVDDGEIVFAGRDIADPRINPDSVRGQIGMVFQAYNLFPHMTVLENIVLAPVRVFGRERAEAEAAARQMLDRVGLLDKAGRKPDQLSGGQQQRVAIARALVNQPRLMLFDEVTSALDPELVLEVLSLLRDLKNDGMTMLVATHEMGFARRVADRVCLLSRGAIAECAPPEAFFDAPQSEAAKHFLGAIRGAGRV
ncbi:amino acid ABC transporter ATP-binding protein [Amphibiibacter pelophylacis]|uniref:Amino acid ABC transporter ATP-binding protein n=1 Tax=Amphibiibacter pelophylacis TaxID=1799477 RepID=A0ACC6P2T9_9BURK